jgi:DNA-binding transcriptional LysR family regulator
MEINQIRYFLAVCETKNFTHAAQKCFVSQPSLTASIKKLEDELEGKLFNRSRSGCQLTSLGELIHPQLSKIVEKTKSVKVDAFNYTKLNTVPIRIGLMNTIGGAYFTQVLAEFQNRNLNTELELIIDTEKALFDQLQNNKIDILISAPLQKIGKSYQSSTLYTENYVVAFHPEHPFNDYEKITLSDIQGQTYLDRLNCELREKLKQACESHKVQLYAAYRSNSEEWILNMVRTNMGVALLPEYTLLMQDHSINTQRLHSPNISRQVCALYKSSASSEAKVLVDLLQQN